MPLFYFNLTHEEITNIINEKISFFVDNNFHIKIIPRRYVDPSEDFHKTIYNYYLLHNKDIKNSFVFNYVGLVEGVPIYDFYNVVSK